MIIGTNDIRSIVKSIFAKSSKLLFPKSKLVNETIPTKTKTAMYLVKNFFIFS